MVYSPRPGEIGGAGLDVTEPQPLPPMHPLWSMPNVIVTPHASGHSPLRAGRMQVRRQRGAAPPTRRPRDKIGGAVRTDCLPRHGGGRRTW